MKNLNVFIILLFLSNAIYAINNKRPDKIGEFNKVALKEKPRPPVDFREVSSKIIYSSKKSTQPTKNETRVNFDELAMDFTTINKYKNKKLIALQDIIFPDRRSHEEEVPSSFGYTGKWYWGVTLILQEGKMIDVKYSNHRKKGVKRCVLSFNRSTNPKFAKPYMIPKGTKFTINEIQKSQNSIEKIYHINIGRSEPISLWCTVDKERYPKYSITDFYNTIDGIFDIELGN